MAQPVGQGALQLTVGGSQSGVGTDGITEGEMPVECRSADGANVQVMGRGAGGYDVVGR